MKLKIDNSEGVTFCVFLDGVLQTTCIEADDEESFIRRYVAEDGVLEEDSEGDHIIETVFGAVEIIHIDDVLKEYVERIY